jgi:hypothetical protein
VGEAVKISRLRIGSIEDLEEIEGLFYGKDCAGC